MCVHDHVQAVNVINNEILVEVVRVGSQPVNCVINPANGSGRVDRNSGSLFAGTFDQTTRSASRFLHP